MKFNNDWVVDPLSEAIDGHITPDGILYAEELHSAQGSDFLLLCESTHTQEDLEKAAGYLRGNFDVVNLWVQKMDPKDEERVLAWKKERSAILEADARIQAFRDIVSSKTAGWIEKARVDLYTASVVVQIYDRINPENQKKFSGYTASNMILIAFDMAQRISRD